MTGNILNVQLINNKVKNLCKMIGEEYFIVIGQKKISVGKRHPPDGELVRHSNYIV